jgi:hypothetical protein
VEINLYLYHFICQDTINQYQNLKFLVQNKNHGQDRRFKMNIERQRILNGNVEIPSVLMTPSHSKGAAIVIHGYGGSKEEQLGLAWRIAEIGITTIAIDLRGHGENSLPMDEGIVPDLQATVAYMKTFGKVTVIGHSLGGRLALLSDADHVIAISPALNQNFTEATQNVLKSKRSYRVKEGSPDTNFEILKKLPLWQPSLKKTMLLYGSRDVPEIIQACQEFKSKDILVCQIEQAFHSDTYLTETTFTKIIEQCNEWYNSPISKRFL